MSLTPQLTAMTISGFLHEQLKEEGRVWTWFLNGSAQYVGTCQKWAAGGALQPHTRVALKASGRGGHPAGGAVCRVPAHPARVETQVACGENIQIPGQCQVLAVWLGA